MGCSDDEAPDEAVKAEVGDGGDVAANPEGGEAGSDEAKVEAPEAVDDQLNAEQSPPSSSDDAPPPEESAPAPDGADDQASTPPAEYTAPPELPAENESDAMLTDAETHDPVEAVEAVEATPPQASTEVTLEAPVQEAKVTKHTKFTPVAATSNGAKGSGGTYVVQPGDTLAGISAKIYGQSDLWHPMATLNGINEPYRIFPGDELQFDASNARSKAFAQSQHANSQQVTVKSGDTLSSIAQTLYGNAGHWKVLFAHNKDKIQDPNRIDVGMVLSYIAQGSSTAAADEDAVTPKPAAKKGKKTAGKASKKPPMGVKVKKTTGH